MEISIQEFRGFKLIVLSGQISMLKDSISLKSQINTLLEENATRIAISLKQMDYIDSAALNVFMYAKNQVDKSGGEFCIIEPNEYILDVLSVLGLKDFFRIIPSKEGLNPK